MSKVIQALEQRQLRKDLPQFKAGDTVKVHFRVIEGRARASRSSRAPSSSGRARCRETFTVRKQSFGVGVERTFPLHSPKIERIEVIQIGDVNRAKLYRARKWERRASAPSSTVGRISTDAPAADEEADELEEGDEACRGHRARSRGRARARRRGRLEPDAEAELEPGDEQPDPADDEPVGDEPVEEDGEKAS